MGHDFAAATRLNAAAMKEASVILAMRASPMTYDAATGLRPEGGAAASAGGPPLLRKRLRLHPHWKLRPVRRWVDFAPYVSSISLTFDPALYGSAGARELARQVQGTKVREKYSSCAVKVTETEDGVPAIVEIKWVSHSLLLAR
jgi:hypothetical protein